MVCSHSFRVDRLFFGVTESEGARQRIILMTFWRTRTVRAAIAVFSEQQALTKLPSKCHLMSPLESPNNTSMIAADVLQATATNTHDVGLVLQMTTRLRRSRYTCMTSASILSHERSTALHSSKLVLLPTASTAPVPSLQRLAVSQGARALHCR